MQRLEHIIERSNARGIQMRFVVPPRRSSTALKQIMPIYERLNERIKIDLGDPRSHPEFYAMENSFDLGHLNSKGAEMLTHLLAEKFIESLTD